MDLEPLAPVKHFSKGAILLRQGDYATVAYRVVKGCLKSYVIDSNGKEHILQFAPEGWVLSDMDGILNDKPSAIFIDAVEHSEVQPLSKSNFRHIIESKDALTPQIVVLLMRSIIAANKRLISLLSATGEERYLDFTSTYPGLVQRLPLKLVASYIGVTPEYLSEIRRKLAHR